jgi:hypothetical protein
MRQPHERLAQRLGQWAGRTDIRMLLTAFLALAGAIGWLHDKYRAFQALEAMAIELDAQQAAQGIQLRDLRDQLSNCRRPGG